jgi:hypothetical protein
MSQVGLLLHSVYGIGDTRSSCGSGVLRIDGESGNKVRRVLFERFLQSVFFGLWRGRDRFLDGRRCRNENLDDVLGEEVGIVDFGVHDV